MRTDRTHYTVPELVAFDIELNPPPPGMVVNCISCWGVSRQGVPDKHTVAWYPLAKTPASAKKRAREMTRTPEPLATYTAWECTCGRPDEPAGPTHRDGCFYFIPF